MRETNRKYAVKARTQEKRRRKEARREDKRRQQQEKKFPAADEPLTVWPRN